jgi:hypothetical protein
MKGAIAMIDYKTSDRPSELLERAIDHLMNYGRSLFDLKLSC